MTEPFAAADRGGEPISATGERIQAIIDAATEAASQIRADAQEGASREADRLTMRRIGEMSRLTDSLIERAESLRDQADVLARAMEDAMRAVVALPGDASARAVAPEPPAAVGIDGGSAPSLEAEPAPRAPEPARVTPAMRAAKMAIAGSGREEIRAALTREYGIRDPDPILNQILGRDG